MLKVTDITKCYNRKKVLQQISFTASQGTVTGIIGPNGAGKSTLLKIITGFERADDGNVAFRSHDLKKFHEYKAAFAYMPERLELYPHLPVNEYLSFIQRSVDIDGNDLLQRLNLSSLQHIVIGKLSKGYRQRLKLFTAMLNRKPLVVLDEPFDGFDPIQLREIISLIEAERQHGRTFILSIHQLYDAEKICDNFVLLNDGRSVAEGDLSSLGRQFSLDSPSLEEIFIKALS